MQPPRAKLKRAASADDLQALWIIGLCGADMEHTQDPARPLEHCLHGILGLDLMQQITRPSENAVGRAEKVAEEIKVVRRLIGHNSAPFSVPGSAPGSHSIVERRACPHRRQLDALNFAQQALLQQPARSYH